MVCCGGDMVTTRDHPVMEKRRLKAAAFFEKGHSANAVVRNRYVRRQSAHAWKKAW